MSTTTPSPEQTTTSSSASITPADSTTATSTTAPAPETPSQPTEDQSPEPNQEASSDNREAAKYRVRLREAEAERDALAQRLDSVTVNVIEDKLRNLSLSTKALQAAGIDLHSVYDDDGSFDDQQLLAAVEVAHDKLGLPVDATLNRIVHTHAQTGRINWDRSARDGIVPSAGAGGERTSYSDWEKVLKGN